MIKKTLTALTISLLSLNISAQWNPVTGTISTEWAAEVTPGNVLPEYPRPILERPEWMNLNGLWDYAILPAGSAEPAKFDGKILVPFPVESSLSGVRKPLGGKNELWYRRTFTIPAGWKNKSIILHFGAVDWKAEVYINDIKIGKHTCGYTPFSFDITPWLTSGKQKLAVKVHDPADEGEISHPRGKQVSKPQQAWYTSVSGIWQTVWLEPVSAKHITAVKTTPDIDKKQLSVNICVANTSSGDIVEIVLKDGPTTVATGKSAAGQPISLAVPGQKLWSPGSPFLYDMEISLYSNRKLQDKVKSYAAMRKISIGKNREGDKYPRIMLNNEALFQLGTLDQGWWPDGLYTAPTDAALLYDIQKTKALGFNMIRKHVKVEPARWYTHCDRTGILVWQDMPNSGYATRYRHDGYSAEPEPTVSPETENNFRKEWKEVIDMLQPHPSIVVWVPFNEGWGQFKTREIAEWTKSYDPTRAVNPASGGNHYTDSGGDILDVHNYPEPVILIFDTKRANVIGEYGGIGLPTEGHLWQPEKNWGHITSGSAREATDLYAGYAGMLKTLIPLGICAAVYTQITDVESEVNGLITYDRKVLKLEEDRLKRINRELTDRQLLIDN
jgi:hypothetical protein